MLKRVINIIIFIQVQLDNNIGFVDGNKMLSNEQYLEILLEEEKNKVKKKEKRGYYEYKGNYSKKKKW